MPHAIPLSPMRGSQSPRLPTCFLFLNSCKTQGFLFFLANALPISQLSGNFLSFPKTKSETAGPIERFEIKCNCRITKVSHTMDGTKAQNNESTIFTVVNSNIQLSPRQLLEILLLMWP